MGILRISYGKIILTLCLLVFGTSAFAQINKTDQQGRKQGEWVKNHPGKRSILYKGQFVNDVPVGTFTYYYPSSKVKAIIKHDQASKTSVGYFYHDNGELMTYGKYKNFKKDSLWYNFDPSGRISFTEMFKEDSLHGKKTVYFISDNINDKSERISRILHYKNGKLDGEYKEWFDFGGSRAVGQYKDNKKVGLWEDFQASGKIMTRTRYKNGVRHGWCFAYDASGVETNKSYYFHGNKKEGKNWTT